jgi:proteasome lid subunit RPN8/RPN11
MGIVLRRTIVEEVCSHAERGYPEEVCGGLLGRVREDGGVEVLETAVVENSREDDRQCRYLVGPSDVVRLESRAEATGLQVIGYYHSHPDAPAEPSDFDREHAWPWYTYLIVSIEDGQRREARAWRLADDRGGFIPVPMNEDDDVDTQVRSR